MEGEEIQGQARVGHFLGEVASRNPLVVGELLRVRLQPVGKAWPPNHQIGIYGLQRQAHFQYPIDFKNPAENRGSLLGREGFEDC